MNRTELSKILAEKTKITVPQADKLIKAFGDTIYRALANDEKVVYSNFGTFYKVHYPSKVIYHPKNKENKMIMLPTDVVKWMPSGNIKDIVNSGIEVENAVAHGTRKKTSTLNSKKSSVIATDKSEIEKLDIAPENSNENEEVSIPINTKKNIREEEEDSNIYEELMHDGSKEMATFKGAIKVHRNKGFLGRFFNKDFSKDGDNNIESTKTSEVNNKEKSKPNNPIGLGIFDSHVSQALPERKKLEPLPEPEKKEQDSFPSEKDEEEISIPITLNKTPEAPSSEIPTKIEETKKTTLPDESFEIIPFKKEPLNVSYVDLSKLSVPKELLQIIPEKLARKYRLVPIDQTTKDITIAMADPQDLEAKELVKKIAGKELTVKLASEEDISHVLDQYTGFESELNEAIETAGNQGSADETDKNVLIESASDNAPAARIVTSILRRAIRDKASDVHIEPSEKEMDVRFRQDGILRKTVKLPKDIQSAVISRIKILSNLKIDEQRLPQDGRFTITFDNRKVDFRVSTMPVANGEKVVMRVLDKVTGILTIDQLGIRGQGLNTLKDSIERSHGMTLVTGPTGSGKTTTLYALIDTLYSEGVNIITLEDPIEYRMPGINQSQVNAEINYTFASGLRSIVRQDPDIIMIGEVRDGETAEMAVHAALTGHIVLSTLHTNDAAGAVPRLLDMQVEPFLLTSSLNTVIGQRLARKICDDCKEELKMSKEELSAIQEEIKKMPQNVQTEIAKKPLKFFKGKGCKNCNDTGYKGRIGLYEVLGISEPIKEMILSKESSFKIQEKAIEEGMVTMLQDGILKALDGITTSEEVWRITKE